MEERRRAGDEELRLYILDEDDGNSLFHGTVPTSDESPSPTFAFRTPSPKLDVGVAVLAVPCRRSSSTWWGTWWACAPACYNGSRPGTSD